MNRTWSHRRRSPGALDPLHQRHEVVERLVLLVAVQRDAAAPLAPLEHGGDRLETGEVRLWRAANLDLEIADAVALEVVLERFRQAVGDRLADIRRR